MSLDQIVGPNGNKEFTELVTVLGCNVGSKFDISKLNYDKIVIASDADVDGLWIRSLLLAFFFKVLPEVVNEGKLYIAEPPLYRIEDKKNPFVINMQDYLNRYVIQASKEYKLGYKDKSDNIEWLDKKNWTEFLDDTKNYVDDINNLVNHYNVNSRLIEIVLEEFALNGFDQSNSIRDEISKINIQKLMDRIGEEFREIYYDDKNNIITGVIDTKWQDLEISEELVRRSKNLIENMKKWMAPYGGYIVLRSVKTGVEKDLHLLDTLKILKKYQPSISHRFKGLGENDAEDIKITIMDPNTRTLIRVNTQDYENDMGIFQILRGGNSLDMAKRREMLRNFEINPEDIDT